jgi:hypothetical protein
VHRVDRSYEIGDRVFLRVKPHKSSIKFGKGAKLSPRFLGPLEIMERKGPVAYRLALPDSLMLMHDVFNVSILRHYVCDPTHVIDMSTLQVSDQGVLMVEPICILKHRIRQILLHIKITHFNSVASVVITNVASVAFWLQVSEKAYCHNSYVVLITTSEGHLKHLKHLIWKKRNGLTGL